VRLVFLNKARRFVGLVVLLFFALPLGLSVTGCGHHAAPVVFCFAGDSGPVVGQVATITLSSSLATTGESLNYGQMGQALSATAQDCKGNAVSVKSFTYSSTSSFGANTNGGPIFADINPASGQVCGGTWNRNTGGGIADFTTCTAPSATPVSTSAVALSVTNPPASPAGTATLVLGQATDTVSGTLYLGLGSELTPSELIPLTVPANTTLTALAASINALVLAQSQVLPPQDPNALKGISASVTTGTTQSLTITGPAGAILNTTGTALLDSTAYYLAYVTASANGATSNAIPVFVHPVATGVVLGPSTPGALNGSCPAGTVDPGSDCCPNDTVGTPIIAPPYDGSSCLSQNQVGQLVARVYQGGGTTGNLAQNITCQVGHLTFGAQTTGIVSIDQNGAATAQQPGSTTITATISQSSTATNAGYFSTCPPASIVLADPSSSSNPINVAVNTLQPLTATVRDTNGVVITGLSLEYNSTTPQTIPAAVGSVTPAFPGSADITAVCQPATCNPSPFNQIGLYGNGKAITSNPITINTPGTSSTVLYMGSTSSDYLAFRDFTTNQTSTLIKLPFVPNSMVMNQAGTEIYLGSPQGLMTVATASNTVSAANQLIPGVVLSVSPDGSTLVITDPTRQTISLVSTASNSVTTSYGGVGTSASWSPDDQAVYITTTTNTVLTHSNFTDWQTSTADEVYTGVTVTVPSVGAYFAGPKFTDGRSYCPASTVGAVTIPGTPPNVANQFIPLVDEKAAMTDQIAATTDGKHILGAHAILGGASTLSDIDVTLPLPPTNPAGLTNYGCPIPPAAQPAPGYFTSTFTVQPLTGINAASITGVLPSSNSAVAFVTYTLPTGATSGGGSIPLYFPPASGSGTVQELTLGNGATVAAAPVAGVFSTDNFTFYVGTGAADGTSANNDVHLITMTYPTSGQPTATEATGSEITPQLPLSTGTGFAPVNLVAQHPKKTTT
jgi:trimeric autotransporter adhesin